MAGPSVDARCLPDGLGYGADIALLDFSVSQIVSGRTAAQRLMRDLLRDRYVHSVLLLAHDHAYAGPPTTPNEVRCDIVEATACGRLWCRCAADDHGAARLRTTVPGTTMAQGIEEYAFDADGFCEAVQAAVPANVHVRMERPFVAVPRAELHWLLRSLVFVHITNN